MLSICKHASSTAQFPLPYSPCRWKQLILMFPNVFSSMMTVTVQASSILQEIKWQNLSSVLMVFTGQESAKFNAIQDGRKGKAQQVPILNFLNTFWLLVFIFLPHCSKISGSYLVPVPNYWRSTKTTPQNQFSEQICI